jgi:dipeptidyl aminopeptidase/acylaminoacyl peptidase
MTLLDIAELQRLATPRLSPDGRTLAYSITKVDWKLGRPVAHLWRQAIGGEPVQLTFTAGGDAPPPIAGVRWSPDGKSILFARDGQLYLISSDGGEPRAVTKHPTQPSSPVFSPDGGTIYFVATDPASAEDRERSRVRDDVFAFEENTRPRHLWKVDLATGAETQITTGAMAVFDFSLSNDGTRIAFKRAPTTLVGDAWRAEVAVMDASGANQRVLTHNDIEEDSPLLSPDNRQMLFIARMNDKAEPYYPDTLFVVPAAGGEPTHILDDFTYTIDDAAWSADGKSVLAVANVGVHSEVIRIDVASHRVKQLTDGQHYIPAGQPQGWQVTPTTMMMQLDQPSRWGDAWTMPIGGGALTQITHVYDPLERDFILPKQEKVEWKGADGAAIEGILIYPLDYRPATRYPLILQMHGGPFESDKFGGGSGQSLNYFPVLAAKGYFVLRPNYRGSAGYGDAFFRGVVGDYFRHMDTDVMNGIDALIARGLVDPDRLGMTGWSAGGTLVNRLITTTDRFKAASAGASIANWISLFAQSEVRAYRVPWFGGTPWQKNAPIDRLWGTSPLKDVARVKTPTIFFVGENDPRVGQAQSLEMFRGLQSNNVPTHLYVGPGEGHTWGGPRHLIFKGNAELEWFETYVMGRSYTWERAPTR